MTSDPATSIFDANDVGGKLAECLKACLNPRRGRGGKRIGTLASEDALCVPVFSSVDLGPSFLYPPLPRPPGFRE